MGQAVNQTQRVEVPLGATPDLRFPTPFANLNVAALSVDYIDPTGNAYNTTTGVTFDGQDVVFTPPVGFFSIVGDWRLNVKIDFTTKLFRYRRAVVVSVTDTLALYQPVRNYQT